MSHPLLRAWLDAGGKGSHRVDARFQRVVTSNIHTFHISKDCSTMWRARLTSTEQSLDVFINHQLSIINYHDQGPDLLPQSSRLPCPSTRLRWSFDSTRTSLVGKSRNLLLVQPWHAMRSSITTSLSIANVSIPKNVSHSTLGSQFDSKVLADCKAFVDSKEFVGFK